MANQQQYWQFEVFGTDPDLIGFFGSAGIILPSGSTAARPASATLGHMRFNTDSSEFEGFNGSVWAPLGSSAGSGTFVGLTDTPGVYTGTANQVLIVNSTETDVEFSTALTLENSGRLRVPGGYESLVTADTVVPNKKYADDQDNLRLALAGGLMGGAITMGSNAILGLPITPTSGDEAASKAYVDQIASGIDFKESVHMGTVANLPSTYSNGAAGLGATLTATTPGVLPPSITDDHAHYFVGTRVLVKDQTDPIENGIYEITVTGTGEEVTEVITAPDIANSLDGTYFTFDDGTTSYYVWMDTPAGAGDPAPGGTGIMVSFITGAPVALVTSSIISAINASPALVTAYDDENNSLYIVNDSTGVVTDATAGTSGFGVTVAIQGTGTPTAWVLTRTTDADNSPTNEVSGGMFTFVEDGATLASQGWILAEPAGDAVIGTDELLFTVISGAGGDFLPLAGGIMTGTIVMGAPGIQISGDITTATAPVYSFTGDLGTGLHQIGGPGTMSLVIGTAAIWNVTPTALNPAATLTQDIGAAGLKVKDVYADHFLPNFGAVGDPSYAFEGATTTGMYNDGSGGIGFAIGGSDALSIESDGTLSVDTASYETLVLADNDVPNKKYVDDSITAITVVADIDLDTKIDVEEGADDDTIRMDVGDTPAGYGPITDIFVLNAAGLAVAMGTPTAGGGVVGAPIGLTAGDGGAEGGVGGSVSITSGTGTTTGAGGEVSITAGVGGSTSGDGGPLTFTAGRGGSGGDGGTIDVVGGQGGAIGGGSGGALTFSGGIAYGDGDGGSLSITGGAAYGGGYTGLGGVVSITGGVGYKTSNAGGDVTITGGITAFSGGTAYGADVIITGGIAVNGTSGNHGGDVQLVGADGGVTSGDGGEVSVTSGDSTTVGAGGNISITTGAGGATSGDAGDIVLVGGPATAGAGGAITLTGGTASSSGVGGNILLTAGSPGTGSAGSPIGFFSSSADVGTGGSLFGFAGAGGSSAGAGGPVIFTSGAGGTGGGVGGDVSLTTGVGDTTGAGGAMALTAGKGGATGDGGAITINAGDGGITSGDGGDASLIGGDADGSGAGGDAIVTAGAGASVGGAVSITAGASSGADTGGVVTVTAGVGGATTGSGGSISLSGGAALGSSTAATQEVDVGGVRVGGDATGLTNDATVYQATITINGTNRFVNITGSNAQTYTTLISEITTDLQVVGFDKGTASLTNGNILITSDDTGSTASISIADGGTPLFSNLTDYVAINAAVAGISVNGGALALTSGAAGTFGDSGAISLTTGSTTDGIGGGIALVVGASTGTNRGGHVDITAGAGSGTSAFGGHAIMTAGTSSGSYSGGYARIRAGMGGPTGGGGSVSIDGGYPGGTNENGGGVTIDGADGDGTATGGGVFIEGGASGTGGEGGLVRLLGGYIDDGTAGAVEIYGGTAGTSATSTGGTALVQGGQSYYGRDGGAVTIQGGSTYAYGYAGTNKGGAVNIFGGTDYYAAAGYGDTDGGDINIVSGSPFDAGDAGNIVITGADAYGGSYEGFGGSITIKAGRSDYKTDGVDVTITGGDADYTGGDAFAGHVIITGGAGLTGDNTYGGDTRLFGGDGVDGGGEVNLSGGDATGTGSGGDITLKPGNDVGGTAVGAVVLTAVGAAAGETTELRFRELSANGSQYVGFKAPDVIGVSDSVVWTLPALDATASGQILSSNASGILSWIAAGAAAGSRYDEAFDDSDLTAGVVTITHSLGRQYVHVTIYDNTDVEVQADTITATSTSVTTIDLSSFGTLTGTWNVVIS